MKQVKLHIKGETQLMLNNPQSVNPLNRFTKALKPLTSKRVKTDDDQLDIARLKFFASLYTDKPIELDGKWKGEAGHYILPAEHFAKSFSEAAKENRLGQKFIRSVFIYADSILDFPNNDKSPKELWNIGEPYVDTRAVGIKNVKIITTRALIPDWECDVVVNFDEGQLNKKEILQAVEIAGLRYGVGTYRQRFGKFTAKEIK